MPSKSALPVQPELIEQQIYLLRGQRVMLDSNLAVLYGVETKALNRAVKRNHARFPPDFMFQLSPEEAESLRRQIGTSRTGEVELEASPLTSGLEPHVGHSNAGRGGRHYHST